MSIMETHNYKSMLSCLVEMQLADYYSGHRQVRRVARKAAREVNPKYRDLLNNISRSKHASTILNQAVKNLSEADH